jgi:D-alanyl-D-alanine carboxypeptidase/Putative peptidoglycan binding domain
MPNFGNYNPSSFGWSHCDGADIVPYSFDGAQFAGGVTRLAVPIFDRALSELKAWAGLAFDTRPSVESGNWGFECRKVGGSGSWSFHAYGLALDIAAPHNPQHDMNPPPSPWRVPNGTGARLSHLGIEWGGDWSRSSVDRMHIEIHLSPDEIGAIVGLAASAPAVAGTNTFPLPGGSYYGPYSGPAESISGNGGNDGRYRDGLARAQRMMGIAADGYYGPTTAAATRIWQAAHGLAVDGLIGPDTWRSYGF